MAKFEETRELYEVLIRFDGGYKGSHAQYIETVKKDGVVLTANVSDAVPLSEADLSAVMNDAQKAAMEAANALKIERDDLTTRLNGVQNDLAMMTQERDDALSERDQAREQAQRARDEAAATIAERDAQIASQQAALSKASSDIEAGNANRLELAAYIQQLTAALEAAKTPE